MWVWVWVGVGICKTTEALLLSASREMVVFKEGDSIYHSKVLSFYRKKSFDLIASYQQPSLLPYPTADIGTFSVKDVKPTEAGEASKVKVKVRMNIHGVFFVKTASMIERLPEVPEEAMETDKPANAESAATTVSGGSTDTSDISQGETLVLWLHVITYIIMYMYTRT